MFKDRLIELLDKYNMKAIELSEKTGISRSLISKYTSGTQMPKRDNLIIIADFFKVNPNWLLEKENYYENEETSAIAQDMFENKELRLLFDAAKDCDPDTLNKVRQMLEILKNKEVN